MTTITTTVEEATVVANHKKHQTMRPSTGTSLASTVGNIVLADILLESVTQRHPDTKMQKLLRIGWEDQTHFVLHDRKSKLS